MEYKSKNYYKSEKNSNILISNLKSKKINENEKENDKENDKENNKKNEKK